MSKLKLQKVVTAVLIALLASTSLATLLSVVAPTVAVAQQLRTKTISGSIKGGEFAKIWLGLEPEQSGATITVVAEWDRENATSNGVGFFILDEEGLKRVGDEALSSIAVAGGNSSFFLNGASNVQGASFNAIGLAKYTLVIYNDSSSAGNFKVTATNAIISDDSNQVTDPSAPATTSTAATSSAAAPASQTITSTTTTTTTTTAPAAAPVTTTAAAPAATPTPAPAAVAAPQPSGPVSATTMEGELLTLDAQHFLGLTPSQRDGEITLRLTFDPQDSSELARRLNFWVLDNAGFIQFQNGSSLSEEAIAAGNRDPRGDSNERRANFKAVNLGPYTVIVENKSRVPATYQLRVDGGVLLDDSGQTKTAQSAAVSATGAVTSTASTATTQTTAAPAASAAPAAGSAAAGTPGGTYTVKTGDSLSTIARDIYGDLQLYRGICTFNGIANCDVIEVGDVINLPTLAQIQSGTTAPAATTAARPTPTRAPAAAQPAASTAVTRTTGVTTTAAITDTAEITTTAATTETAPVEDTDTVTTTTVSTTTATSTNATAPVSNANIVDVLTADGRFTSLVRALQATGLDKVLKGSGPFTVFAPTDAAFGTLPRGAFEQLLADPSGQLKDILLYHVVSSKTMAGDLSNNLQATTVQGKPVKFTVQNGGVRINSAGITESDIEASNGVVHVIDNVILPPPK